MMSLCRKRTSSLDYGIDSSLDHGISSTVQTFQDSIFFDKKLSVGQFIREKPISRLQLLLLKFSKDRF